MVPARLRASIQQSEHSFDGHAALSYTSRFGRKPLNQQDKYICKHIVDRPCPLLHPSAHRLHLKSGSQCGSDEVIEHLSQIGAVMHSLLAMVDTLRHWLPPGAGLWVTLLRVLIGLKDRSPQLAGIAALKRRMILPTSRAAFGEHTL